MTKPPTYTSRIRIIRFAYSLTDENREAIKKRLSVLDNLSDVRFTEKQLSVHYQFPLLNLDTILAAVNSLDKLPEYSSLCRLGHAVILFMEQNEQDYAEYACGWQRYVEDIYIFYFDILHGNKFDVRQQQWRKYNKGSKR